MNIMANRELIVFIDMKTSSGKVAFNVITGYKNKNCSEGNAAMARERSKNKYEPNSQLFPK
jgi:hypothetical protein